MDYPTEAAGAARTLEDWERQAEELRAELAAARETIERLERRVDWCCDYLGAEAGGGGECPPCTWTADFDCDACENSTHAMAACWRQCLAADDGVDAPWREELQLLREECGRLERTLRLVLERIAADRRGRPADPEIIEQLVAAMMTEGDAAARLDQALAALAATEEDGE